MHLTLNLPLLTIPMLFGHPRHNLVAVWVSLGRLSPFFVLRSKRETINGLAQTIESSRILSPILIRKIFAVNNPTKPPHHTAIPVGNIPGNGIVAIEIFEAFHESPPSIQIRIDHGLPELP